MKPIPTHFSTPRTGANFTINPERGGLVAIHTGRGASCAAQIFRSQDVRDAGAFFISIANVMEENAKEKEEAEVAAKQAEAKQAAKRSLVVEDGCLVYTPQTPINHIHGSERRVSSYGDLAYFVSTLSNQVCGVCPWVERYQFASHLYASFPH